MNIRKKACPTKKPNEITCPTRLGENVNRNRFCGIYYEGKYKGFDRACSVCKDLNVKYYY